MKMPSSELAEVPVAKVIDYLLSKTHPRGSMKAVWFNSLGFKHELPNELISALRSHAKLDIEESEGTQYGTKYSIAGEIIGPDGSTGQLRSVWIIRTDENYPRLVTAYPGK